MSLYAVLLLLLFPEALVLLLELVLLLLLLLLKIIPVLVLVRVLVPGGLPGGGATMVGIFLTEMVGRAARN